MTEITPLTLAVVFCAASVVALGIIWCIARFGGPGRSHPDSQEFSPSRAVNFLFHNEQLSDLDAQIEALPGSASSDIRDWTDLRAWLGARFGPLPTSLSDISEGEVRDFPAAASDDCATLSVSVRKGAQRVLLMDPSQPDPAAQHRARAIDALLARYITVLNKSPCAIRIFDPVGQTVWQNEVFSDFSEDEAQKLIDCANDDPEDNRICLPGEHTGQDRHYEVQEVHRGEVRILYALEVTQVVQAEMVRREFIQTLTKTFANLTTGLAVFDRHRQLALFNPALLDLTHLPAPFLISQPPLTQFFDRLRDNKVLPEPKNYDSWRNHIDEMISSASDGLYLEDWSLPNGATYRVTGRPHPDGAIAFLFEDISDEVSLTRRFRSQVDLRQIALDACDQAIAVIGPSNIVTLCNTPCSAFLAIDPDASFAEMTMKDFLSACQDVLPNPAFWARAETALLNRSDIKSALSDKAGRVVQCQIRPLPGNSMMVSFLDAPASARTAPQHEEATG